jgi:hypothetical protein
MEMESVYTCRVAFLATIFLLALLTAYLVQ